MELNERLLKELQNRLKVGNRRGVHLNAIPGRSRYKFDLNRLTYLDSDLPKKFIEALLSEQPLKFKISWRDNDQDLNSLFEDEKAELVRITKSFENLINQTEAIESEKGLNTFGFGFPLLIRRDQSDGKLTVAPILIWSLQIQRSREFNTWIINRKEDDPIYINEVLINHLQSDSGVRIDPISSEMLEDGLIDRNELLDICVRLTESINTDPGEELNESYSNKLDNLSSIKQKSHYEGLPLQHYNSMIEFAGLFSIFEVQKQNIIQDYKHLLELNDVSLNLDEMVENSFQPISSVETDPSQQGVLNSLNSTRNTLIQGPPGTGKSQSLTAVLVNALENGKKTVVVCEKRTALEVLQEALIERGLGDHCALIKDHIKDRKKVVDSVRRRIDTTGYLSRGRRFSSTSLPVVVKRAKSIIELINRKHKELSKQLFDTQNWTSLVGNLLAELRANEEDYEIEVDVIARFNFTPEELDEILAILDQAEKLYKNYEPFAHLSFANPRIYDTDNPYELEDGFHQIFEEYENQFKGPNSELSQIREENEGNDDFFNYEKTGRLTYRLFALISKKRRKTLTDQKKISQLTTELAEKLNSEGWIKRSIAKENLERMLDKFEELFSRKRDFFENESEVFSLEYKWFHFYNSQNQNDKILIDSLKTKVNWTRVFLINYLKAILKKNASSHLPTSDDDHQELRKSLASIGQEQLAYVKGKWYKKQASAKSRFNSANRNLALKNLYNKRSSQNHKRLSLRKIVKYNPDVFTTFFPVILTTPDVCSNLFMGMNGYFDIVLFDEASQLRLEDNLPAILKGKQVIIAGDEHQMPPSNYFGKIFDGTIEDEEEIDEEIEEDTIHIDHVDLLLQCESLLEFASELNFEKKYLDFHYRSRHPYLIDFSNAAFYSNRLKPLPNQFDYTPIKYLEVDGTFSGHSNEKEAETVLELIENHIHRLPNGDYPSVGVATFNISQRNLIMSKILERQKLSGYEQFNSKIDKLNNEGFFVKNLENIQGDERDIIILSTTYGINSDGRFYHRFGPVNHKKGYKLLNVIITRAKYRVYVCSSIPEEVFLNYREFLVTEGANNRRAVFFAYLAYAKAVSENDEEKRQSILSELFNNSGAQTDFDINHGDLESPFEEEVYQVLLENFDRDQLIPQLQYAGFRIDIVYKPSNEDAPRVAIECDGASYHSSDEAYLYDHHRQKILESQGFVFHRIWSTKWWRNPKREARRLIEFILSIESQTQENETVNPDLAQSFPDEIEIAHTQTRSDEPDVGAYNLTNEFVQNQGEASEEVSTTESDRADNQGSHTDIQKSLFDSTIKEKNVVRIFYENRQQELTVMLDDEDYNNPIEENGVLKLPKKNPLAASILGKSVGDTVRIGSLDTFVNILEIIE